MKTFLDAGVLIAAYRGQPAIRKRALEILDESDREFVTSDFVRLEIIPKAVYHKRQDEVAFYELIFSKAISVTTSPELFDRALREAKQCGLNAVDALHAAAAKAEGCPELYTTERTEKPLFRVTGLSVKSLA